MRLLTRLLDLLYPPKCVICQRLLQDDEIDICAPCRQVLPYYEGNGRHGEFFEVCTAPLVYDAAVRESLLRYKFHGCSFYAPAYGRLLASHLRKQAIDDFDILTWVPISAKRRRKRGYDQAKLLAGALAEELQKPLTCTVRKIKNNPAQSSMNDAAMRRGNVQGAYVPYEPETLHGKRVLLVDDICTTGATLSECSRVLLTAGAQSVVCVALAMTEKNN